MNFSGYQGGAASEHGGQPEAHRRGQIGMWAALQGEAVYSHFNLETALFKRAMQQRLYLALEIEKHLNTSMINLHI
jgi:hypothetical protein